MKRTRSYYLGRFRTIDQLLFIAYILIGGIATAMVFRSLELYDSKIFRFCWVVWIICGWTVLRTVAKGVFNGIAKRRGDDVPFDRDNIQWSRDKWFSRADDSDLEY